MSRAAMLDAIAEADELSALQMIGAFHNGASGLYPLRSKDVAAAGHVFPSWAALPELLAMVLIAQRQLLRDCKSSDDAFVVAAFAMYGITAIHPFANGNGRSAFDFAAYLLRNQYDFTLEYRGDEQKALAIAFAPLDDICDGSEDAQLRALASLSARFDTSLFALWENANLVAVAHFLADRASQPFTARL